MHAGTGTSTGGCASSRYPGGSLGVVGTTALSGVKGNLAAHPARIPPPEAEAVAEAPGKPGGD